MAASKAEIEASSDKPSALPVLPDAIPAELRERPQWVAWRYERRLDSNGQGKWTKVPLECDTGRHASSTDPATWCPFADALAYYHAYRSTTDGIGFVFSADDPFVGIDLDDARNPQTGEPAPWAAKIVADLDSYAEVSPSGTGVKVFVRGTVPPGGNRKGKVEVYDRGRYFAVTGQRLDSTPATVSERPQELTALCRRLFGATENGRTKPRTGGEGLTPEDAELIRRAGEAANGEKFRRLWAGDASGYASRSEADLALCGLLAFWTGPDPGRIDALFRQSGLMRPKWDEKHGSETYGQRTIAKALAERTEFYAANGQAGPTWSAAPVTVPDWPAPPDQAAYHGLAGEFVRLVGPHSEADPVALLVQFLVGFGAALGRTAHFRAEADSHYLNEYAALAGPTSKSRKGTSWGHVRPVLEAADPQFASGRVLGGLSSGEGLIWTCRDPIRKRQPVKHKGRVVDYQEVEEDPGIADKRLLAFEPEFASVLRRIEGQQGNSLSALLRQAWETGDLRTLTKTPVVATGAHVALVVHCTAEELRRYLSATEQANGFGNRFLWFCVRRSKALPEGGQPDAGALAELGRRLAQALAFGRSVGELRRDDAARTAWHAVYGRLSDGKPGLAGCLLARGEAHVMRLACLYAVLDQSRQVQAEHLLAALALWEHCERSVRYLFGDSLGDPLADEVLRQLRAAGAAGLTRWEMSDFFGRHRSAERIGRALGLLLTARLARSERSQTGGRPVERWFAVEA